MTSTIKVDTIQNSAGTTGLTIDSSGLILPKVPAFEVLKTSNQNLTSGTWTKITFNTENYDTSNSFDLANSKFQPTIAGYYQLNACLYFGSGTNTATLGIIYKNGVLHRRLAYVYHTSASLDDYGIASACMVEANGSTDYFEVYGFAVGTATVNGSSTGVETIWSGHLVSVA